MDSCYMVIPGVQKMTNRSDNVDSRDWWLKQYVRLLNYEWACDYIKSKTP